MVDRAKNVTVTVFQQKNLELTIDTLLNNGYSIDLIFREIKKRIKEPINKLINNECNVEKEKSEREIMVFPYI